MRLKFQPMPGLTIVTLISLVILIGLGSWQYQRLQWKTDLLAEIEQAATAPPFSSLSDVRNAIAYGEPVDFRRIGFSGDYIKMDEPFFVFTAENKDISWRVFAPISNSGYSSFVAGEVIPDSAKDAYGFVDEQSGQVAGYVRLARPDNKPATKSSPERNRWFGFNPMPETHDWAEQVTAEIDMRYYVDRVPGALDASLLPPKRPDIRNNHFDYMLTWYGLAIVMLIIYGVMHHREGRLSWR